LPSTSLLLFNAADISTNVKNMATEVKEYCLTTDCRRMLIAQYFGYEHSEQDSHSCCDNCRKSCGCIECINTESSDSQSMVQKEDETENFVNMVYCELLDLFGHINGSLSTKSRIRNELYTGLSTSLAKQLADDYAKYSSLNNLATDFPFLSVDYTRQICGAIGRIIGK